MRVLLIAPLLAALANAQEAAPRRIEARVTAVTGNVIYLDVGSDGGVEPGDRGRVFAATGTIDVTVRSVSRQSASCELVGDPSLVQFGALAEVLVPVTRAASKAPVEHPPWTVPAQEWDPNVPLLAPTKVPTPPERPTIWSGRWFAAYDTTVDSSGDSQRYGLARFGLDTTLGNAFGNGDVLRFDGEFYRRDSDDGDRSDESESTARIDRLSWRWGDWRENPRRIEVGRFLHSELAQLGVIDGVEYVQRLDGGHRIGASVGLLPAWSDDLASGDDMQASIFGRWFAGDQGELSVATALQKTWHEGENDRDLVLGDVSWRPNSEWWFASSLWLDHYDSGDDPKSAGFEITQWNANASWRPSTDWGLGLSATHVAWPVLLRDELPPATLATISDGYVDRLSLNGWCNVGRKTRLYARADAWESDDANGGGGEARWSRRDWLWSQGELGVSLFTNQGEFSTSTGARLSLSRFSSFGQWSAWYEAAQLEQEDFGGNVEDLLQQVVRGTWDVSFGGGWSLGLSGEVYFGDEQDAQSLGFRLQRGF